MDVLRRLFRFLGTYWRVLTLSVALLLVSAGIGLLPPLFQRQIIDQALGEAEFRSLGVLIGGLVGVYGFQALIGFGDNYTRHALGERFILDLRVRLYAYLQRLSLST